MKKKYLIIAAVVGLIIGGIGTAATSYVDRSNSKITCTPSALLMNVPQSVQWQIAYDNAHPPIPAREKGYPFAYYRELSGADCSSSHNANATPSAGWLLSGLIFDYLIWAVAAVMLCWSVLIVNRDVL